jgi:hypothetical protein
LLFKQAVLRIYVLTNKEIAMSYSMKKTASPGVRNRLLSGLAIVGVTSVAWMPTAMASTAATHIIQNEVTVSYDDAGGVAQTAITATVDVTINLVAATPALSAPLDDTVSPGGTATYTYTITGTANGLDTYDLTRTVFTETGIGSSSTSFNGAALASGAASNVATIALGGTTAAVAIGVISATTDTVITVPADGANDGAINGIADVDSVVIGGSVCLVSGVDDTNGGVPNATSTFTVNCAGDTSVAVGDIIGEQKSFTLDVVAGTLTAPAVDGTVAVTISARDAGAVAAAATDATETTVTGLDLTVAKYVRNITTATYNPADNAACIAAGGTSITVNTGGGAGSVLYCSAGVTGDPGNTLEYVIAVTLAANSSDALDVIITDPIVAFTTYTAGSMRLDPGTGTWAAVTDDVNADAGKFAASTVTIYAGTGGADGGVGGTLTGGVAAVTTHGSFRVTIDN